MSGYNKILTTINSSTTNYTNLVDESVIVIDTSNNRIGINTINPTHSIHISGGDIKGRHGYFDTIETICGDVIAKTATIDELYVSENSIYMGNRRILYIENNNLIIDNSGGEIILNKSTSLNENASFTSSSVTFDSANLNGGYIYGTKVGTKYDDGIQQINRAEAYFSYIDVSGSDSSFNNNVYINNNLNVSNNATFNQDVEISNQLIVNNDASFNNNIYINNDLIVKEGTIILQDNYSSNSLINDFSINSNNITLNNPNISNLQNLGFAYEDTETIPTKSVMIFLNNYGTGNYQTDINGFAGTNAEFLVGNKLFDVYWNNEIIPTSNRSWALTTIPSIDVWLMGYQTHMTYNSYINYNKLKHLPFNTSYNISKLINGQLTSESQINTMHSYIENAIVNLAYYMWNNGGAIAVTYSGNYPSFNNIVLYYLGKEGNTTLYGTHNPNNNDNLARYIGGFLPIYLNFIFKINSDITSCTLIDINNTVYNNKLEMSIKINSNKKAILNISYKKSSDGGNTFNNDIFNINNHIYNEIIVNSDKYYYAKFVMVEFQNTNPDNYLKYNFMITPVNNSSDNILVNDSSCIEINYGSNDYIFTNFLFNSNINIALNDTSGIVANIQCNPIMPNNNLYYKSNIDTNTEINQNFSTTNLITNYSISNKILKLNNENNYDDLYINDTIINYDLSTNIITLDINNINSYSDNSYNRLDLSVNSESLSRMPLLFSKSDNAISDPNNSNVLKNYKLDNIYSNPTIYYDFNNNDLQINGNLTVKSLNIINDLPSSYKTFYYNHTSMTWLEHKNYAEQLNMQLACLSNLHEWDTLKNFGSSVSKGEAIFLGGKRKDNSSFPNGTSMDQKRSSTYWEWIDGSEWHNSFMQDESIWRSDEPNNNGGLEYVLEFKVSEKQLNDGGTAIRGAFYQSKQRSSSTTFTGQHLSLMNKSINISHNGLIVVTNNKFVNLDNSLKPNINQSLPYCSLCNVENSKQVYGVISSHIDNNANLISSNNNNYNRIIINSLGEGAIWVTNKNGPLESGDYISSSSLTGYGQKQLLHEDFLTRFTVAKITCNCDFSLTKIKKQQLLVNSISNESVIVYDNNGDIIINDYLDANNNYVYEYAYETRFLDAYANLLASEQEYISRLNNNEDVYIACFVGCTYHCG